MKGHELPSILPLYEVKSTILLPRAQLPILLQRQEEKAILQYSFSEGHRLVGIIQANPEGGYYQKGCVGRIINFQEGPQTYLTLGGLCRFTVKEILQDDPIMKAKVCYQGYEADLEDMIMDPFVDRPRLLNLLRDYLDEQDIIANWEEIDHASDDLILNSLSMACPFKPVEKQALLELSSLSERCDMVIALMEMASPRVKGKALVLH